MCVCVLSYVIHSFGIDSREAVINYMECSSGHELTALQCSFRDFPVLHCIDDKEDVAVTCCKANQNYNENVVHD